MADRQHDGTEPIPTLAQLPARGREIVLAHIESERASTLALGIAIGRREVYDAWHERAEVSAAVAAAVSRTPSYAELCERRGMPERAAAQRALLVERGIAA